MLLPKYILPPPPWKKRKYCTTSYNSQHLLSVLLNSLLTGHHVCTLTLPQFVICWVEVIFIKHNQMSFSGWRIPQWQPILCRIKLNLFSNWEQLWCNPCQFLNLLWHWPPSSTLLSSHPGLLSVLWIPQNHPLNLWALCTVFLMPRIVCLSGSYVIGSFLSFKSQSESYL